MRKFTLLLALGMLVVFNLMAGNNTSLIPFGSDWKYLDNGSDQGTAWRASGFDDAGWKAGPAILGYGNPPYNHRGESTKVSFGPDPNNTYITTYFRKTITLDHGYDAFKARVKRDDGIVVYVNGVEVFRNNMPQGNIAFSTLASYAQDNGAKEQTFTINKSAFVDGQNLIAVEVHQHSKSSSDLTFDLELEGEGEQKHQEKQNTLIPYKSVWKYLDNGSDQGTAWRASSFADASWKAGPAILGYGNPPYNHRGESTKVSFGPDPNNTYITTYFRKTITLEETYASYHGSVKRDDGVVVYVNGVEVFRDHMPAGEINYLTRARYALDNGMKPQKFVVDKSLLVKGQNVIAVEVHQHNNTSSDLTFDLELEAKGKGKPGDGDQTAPSVLSLNRQTPSQQLTNASAVTFRVTFSEAVTGVDLTDFGLALSGLTATLNTLTPVGTDNKTFDVNVHAIAGSGTLGLNLKASGTDIKDAAGNAIGGGFTGQTYTIDQTAPTILSLNRQWPAGQTTNATAVTFRAIFSEAVTGLDGADFSLAQTGTVAASIYRVVPVGSDGKTFDVNVNAITGNGTLGLNLNASGTGINDAAGNALSGGITGQTYTISQIAPAVLSLSRQTPATEVTTAASVIFRIIFSKAVTGVDAADFDLMLTSSASGSISGVAAVGTDGTTYDITVNQVGGSGTLGLNLKASGTGITDGAGTSISGGFTGQTYTVQPAQITEGFASVTPLTPLDAITDATKEKEQAKVFTKDGHHFAVLADATGTNLWRLDKTTYSWTKILLLSTRKNRADAIVDGNLTHVLMYGGSPTTTPPNITQLITLEHVPANNTYKAWPTNPSIVGISLDKDVETASLAKDGKGRLWVASDGTNSINVRWSDAPYNVWSAPIPLAANVHVDDIAAAVYIPALKKIGVLWSDQNTDRFGFKTHDDGADPSLWSTDEVPASQSALNVGLGMADDHLNMKVGSDGTLYAAVKTSYDTPGAPEIGLLIRRPNGTWDDLYQVAPNTDVSTVDPTLPIVVLNEAIGKLRVIYSSQTGGGEIQYKESSIANISFGNQLTLISGKNNNVASSHQNFTSEIVILASNTTQVVGVLASDVPGQTSGARMAASAAAAAGLQEQGVPEQAFTAYPNPFSAKANLSFALAAGGAYSLTVYESATMEVVYQKQGQAPAGVLNLIALEGASLARGFYFARLQTPEGVKTLRLVLDK